jgi:hypothetical protein
MPTYRFENIHTSSQQKKEQELSQPQSLESTLRDRVVEIMNKMGEAVTEYIIVELEDEEKRVCIGFLGNFIVFSVNRQGNVFCLYEIDRKCEEAPFPFHSYSEHLQEMLQAHVVPSEPDATRRNADSSSV